MKFRFAAVLFILLCPALWASQENEETPQPGILTRSLEFLHLKHREPSPPAAGQGSTTLLHRKLEMKIDISPTPVRLSDTRQMKVTISLFNRSRKYVHLEFPTTQRIELLLKNSDGKIVTQWSEDQSFQSEPASVTVNPGERLEYTASLSTREMKPGQTYTVQAYFPNFEELSIQQPVTAQQ